MEEFQNADFFTKVLLLQPQHGRLIPQILHFISISR
jgi:hypothetical protein